MPVSPASLTYEEAIADWAEAELASPFLSEASFGYLDADLRGRIASGGLASLTDGDRQLALSAFLYFRRPLLTAYGVNRSASFTVCRLRRAEVQALEVIPEIGAGSITLGHLAEQFCQGELSGRMADAVLRIAERKRDGHAEAGRPFAVEPPAPAARLLIEGYKRSMAWLLYGGSDALEMILVRPAMIG